MQLSDAELRQFYKFDPASLRAKVMIQFDVPTPDDPEAFAELVRRWMDQCANLLAREALDVIEAAPPQPVRSLSRLQGAFGEPGTPWGSIVFAPAERRRQTALYAWSPKAWSKILGRAAERPRRLELKLSQLDDWGQPGGGDHYYHFSVERKHDSQHWTSLRAFHSRSAGDPTVWAAVQEQWLGFAKDWAESFEEPPGFGYVADDAIIARGVPLENALGLNEIQLDDGRLRGYSWVTVLGPKAAQRLGGVDNLRESGAFCEVRALPSGAVLAQATPTPQEYTPQRVRKVFEVLAPVLPAGMPTTFPIQDPQYKLVYEDAADIVSRRQRLRE